MQEVFAKIIEKLEEEKRKGHYDFNSVIGEKNVWQKAIEIVKQEAEECKEYALCYLQGPCEYQNKDCRMTEDKINDGWIPCSERLPKKFKKVQITWLGYNSNEPISDGSTAFLNESKQWCWTNGNNIVNVVIVAWRKNLAPYQPKGE